MTGFQGERLVTAVTAVAGSQLVLDDALRHGQERKAFGRPIGTFQAWRHRFAEHLSRLEAARWLTYRACDLFARGQVAFREISMAKLVAGDLAQEIAYDAMQFHGGMGYMTESDVARAWRDLRLLTIGGGTSEIMKELISRGAGM
jgi:citronellyl-CoA dehydrogenase